MTVVTRALAMTAFLAAWVLGGALYTPSPISQPNPDEADISLAALPPLPEWARSPLPDFSAFQIVSERKQAFFGYLYPRIVVANVRVLIERRNLEHLARKDTLTESDLQWLARQSERLRVDAQPGTQAQFDALLRRLDIIPPSLILAQAANESAWGQSRFARRGNNLFGQWCFSQGCGLVPLSRADGANHEVATFSSPYFSVRSYIQNLNRHAAYQSVRDRRHNARQHNLPLSGLDLAGGLLSYSERGEAYVEEIRAMIRFNKLSTWDARLRAQMGDGSDTRLETLASAASPETLLTDQP